EILKEDKKGRWETTSASHKYDEKGKLTEKIMQGSGRFPKGIFIYRYFYDAQGNLIEKKGYKGDEVFNWEKYSYNKKGLLREMFWLDQKTGEISTSILYEYSFYE